MRPNNAQLLRDRAQLDIGAATEIDALCRDNEQLKLSCEGYQKQIDALMKQPIDPAERRRIGEGALLHRRRCLEEDRRTRLVNYPQALTIEDAMLAHGGPSKEFGLPYLYPLVFWRQHELGMHPELVGDFGAGIRYTLERHNRGSANFAGQALFVWPRGRGAGIVQLGDHVTRNEFRRANNKRPPAAYVPPAAPMTMISRESEGNG